MIRISENGRRLNFAKTAKIKKYFIPTSTKIQSHP
jgi:hypothetical protein